MSAENRASDHAAPGRNHAKAAVSALTSGKARRCRPIAFAPMRALPIQRSICASLSRIRRIGPASGTIVPNSPPLTRPRGHRVRSRSTYRMTDRNGSSDEGYGRTAFHRNCSMSAADGMSGPPPIATESGRPRHDSLSDDRCPAGPEESGEKIMRRLDLLGSRRPMRRPCV